MEFSLFRIKVVRPLQQDAFIRETSSPDLVRDAILGKPTSRSSRGFQWHLGNVEEISPTSIYFALGRESRSMVPLRDPDTGDFVESEFESAPYTHVFVDVPSEVCAIAQKSVLAPTAETIARHLARVLNQSEVAREHKIQFSIGPISEPDEFVRELREAYAITSFTVYFTRPNPIDVEQDYLRPMERLTELANGSQGSATIRGGGLDVEPLEELTRSAAATGDNASAKIRLEPGARPVSRSLRGATAKLNQETIYAREDKLSFFDRIRAKYHQVRGTLT